LAAADYLAVALRGEHVVAEHRPWVRGILLHVEGLRLLRVVHDEDGPIMALGEDGLVGRAEIITPFDLVTLLLEDAHCVAVIDARERRLDSLELRQIALQDGQLVTAALECAFNQVGDEVLLETHAARGVEPRDLGLAHPELRQVAPRLGFLGAERRPEAVDATERGRSRLAVQLTGLGEVCLLLEVVDLEQARAALTDRAGQDRRVDADEVALVEEVVDCLLDFAAYADDRPLLARAEPQVTMVEQEVDAVLLRLDGDRESTRPN